MAPPQPPPAHAPPAAHQLDEIDARLRAVERLVAIFRFERIVYITISIFSFLILFVFATYLFLTSGPAGQNKLFLLLFIPPSGAIMYASGASLRMWSESMRLLAANSGR